MEQNWKLGLFVGVVVMCFLCQSFHWSWCLNDEGLALLRFRERVVSDPLGALSNWKEEDVEVDPCSWFGIACSDGKVVVLNVDQTEGTVRKRLLEKKTPPKSPPSPSPSPQPPPSYPRPRNARPHSPYFRPNPAQPPSSSQTPPSTPIAPPPSSQTPPSTPIAPPPSSPSSLVPPSITLLQRSSSSNHRIVAILAGAIGGTILILVIGVYLCIINKVATVKPWATGLSGQLQKAFVTGVPKIKRSELEAACEDFSNVIGSTPIGTVYKGTLSSGVEIAVASVAATSGKGWLNSLEAQFIKKIDTLSKVNHKNFVNLLGYCQEDKPFTRMMVFEYAPNGTLFEHLHIKEAEHLDWGMRLRIAMGMAYCLEHMHQLNPPIAHNNLNSSAISLTEDYAAKISEFTFWNEIVASEIESSGLNNLHTPSACPESNVYSFGVILFEIATGRLPYSVGNASLEDWTFAYLSREEPLREMVDPTLTSFQEDQLKLIGEVLKSCVHPDPKHRPAMREVCARLSTITGITPEAANPKLSPLWWAELEITSADAS